MWQWEKKSRDRESDRESKAWEWEGSSVGPIQRSVWRQATATKWRIKVMHKSTMRNGESIWHCSDSAWRFYFLFSFIGGFVVINVFVSVCVWEGMVGVMELSWVELSWWRWWYDMIENTKMDGATCVPSSLFFCNTSSHIHTCAQYHASLSPIIPTYKPPFNIT